MVGVSHARNLWVLDFMADEIREAILEGAGIELIPLATGGWYARIGVLNTTVAGRTAGEVLLNLADIVSTPPGVGVQ